MHENAAAGGQEGAIRLWEQDGGWYLSGGGPPQGPFLYRPAFVQEWERDLAPSDSANHRIVAHYTQFDAAGEQVTFLHEYQVRPTGARTLVRTSVVEDPPSPDVYEGLENPEPKSTL
jgi:hypothetical protein